MKYILCIFIRTDYSTLDIFSLLYGISMELVLFLQRNRREHLWACRTRLDCFKHKINDRTKNVATFGLFEGQTASQNSVGTQKVLRLENSIKFFSLVYLGLTADTELSGKISR
jgi:hypothetical protein